MDINIQTVLRELDASLTLLYQELNQDYCELGGQTALTRRSELTLTQMLDGLRIAFNGWDEAGDLAKANLYYVAVMELEKAGAIVTQASKDMASVTYAEKLRGQLQVCQVALMKMRGIIGTTAENEIERAIQKGQTPTTQENPPPISAEVTVPIKEQKQLPKSGLLKPVDADASFQEDAASKVVRNLVKYFDDAEFRMLCLELNIDYDTLDGPRLHSKAMDLYLYMRRHGRLEELIKLLRKKRPHVLWELE